MAAKLKSGDEVLVIAGRDKGKTGTITLITSKGDRAVVSGVNKVKRHTKPSHLSAGGIEEKEASIHLSNLAYSHEGVATRIGFKVTENGKTRFAKKSGDIIEG